jgi:uncharacterized membrane protein
LGPPFLAFVIATFLAFLELVTSKYPRTPFLLRRSLALYGYALVYGLIAFGVTLGIGSLINAGVIKLAGIGLSMERYIAPRVRARRNLADVKKVIQNNLPKGAASERAAFLADLQPVDSVVEAMRLYLTFLGRQTFDRVFP